MLKEEAPNVYPLALKLRTSRLVVTSNGTALANIDS